MEQQPITKKQMQWQVFLQAATVILTSIGLWILCVQLIQRR